MDPLDVDPGFEPQTRARSNTWPLPRPDNFVEPEEDSKAALHAQLQAAGHLVGVPPCLGDPGAPKKNSSRRNAWGNMSYADLITQAIQSSPDKRLTLAQIYEWMVQNVAYFKDKGDSNSSAGWKNSIRHNLSLHNRFMRVQNEGTGKSSWWVINPDAKPGKAARRRATSMETQKYEKKRGRVKKKVEALRNGATPSPSSSVSEGPQDLLFPDSPPQVHHGFQLSPDFRPRASSNASSCGGRLSPIPAVESDMHDDGDMPPLSPIPWSSVQLSSYEPAAAAAPPSAATLTDRFTTDHLVKSLAESMKLRNHNGESADGYRLSDCALKPLPKGRPPSAQLGSGGGGYTLNYNPPPYAPPANNGEYRPPSYPSKTPQQVIEAVNGRSSYTLTRLGEPMTSYSRPPMSFLDDMSPEDRTPSMMSLCTVVKEERMSPCIKEERSTPLMSPCSGGAPAYPQHMQLHHHHHHHAPPQSSLVNTASHVVGHLLYNALPQDLDFEPLSGGLECDVDQVIRHELSVDGNLDFNFDPASASSAGGQHHPAAAIASSTRSWVH